MTRIGASQAFFNIVAQFNAEKLIKDTASLNTVMKAVSLDTFEAILKPVDDMILQMDNAINAVKDLGVELGDATVEFEKFYGQAGNMEQVKDDLIAVGEAYAFVGTEALAAGSRAAQVANLIGRQNVDLLVEQAAILAEISDLTLEEAQRGIIQLNQQAGVLYGEMTRQQIMSLSAREQEIILTENAARTLDVLNTVANRSVALEGDLVKTMTNFASGARLAGDSFEFMAAASATLLEAGEEQGTAGRALRMMYARLGGDINGARSKIEEMGFAFTNADGTMKSMQEILEELHTKGWGQLNPAVKQNIAQTIAGNRHYVRFIKLMENYERVTQLTGDAFLRLDSAAEQASVALSSNVRQLQTAEAEVENLKAAIGEGLTPFMIGQTEAQRDYLAATEMLTDGLGEVGKVLGRMMGIFKITEGFVKFGIALQSISIGMEMFASVQRSLQGVEVAVSNLHSKQSTYKEFGVKMTQEEMDLMQGLLHHQQALNRANKEIQLGKILMAGSDEKLKANAAVRAQLEGKITEHNERLLILNDKITRISEMRAAQAAAEDSMYARRAARIDYENAQGRELLEVQKQIYAHKAGAEDAYMRQMLADFDVFGSFNEDELHALREKNESLREQHTILQQIKAENQATRDLRYFDEEAGQMESSRRRGMLQLSEREYQILYATIAGEATKAEKVMAQLTAKKNLTHNEEELLGVVTRQVGQYAALTRELKANEGSVRINDEAFKGLMAVMKQVNGELMATDRAVRTVTAAEADMAKMQNNLKKTVAAVNILEEHKNKNRQTMIQLDLEDMAIKKQIAPLLDIINNAEKTKVEQSRAMTEVIQILTMEMDDNTRAIKRQAAAQYRSSEQYVTDVRRASAAQKSFNMGVSNTIGLLMGATNAAGLTNATTAAAMSMGILGTQIFAAGGAAVASGAKLAVLQYDIYKVQMAAKFAREETAALAATLATAFKMIAPMAAMAAGMYILAKNSEKNAKAMEKLNDLSMEYESTIGRLSAETKLFTDEALAKQLGVANYEMKDLIGNADLTEEVFDKISNNTLNLSQGLRDSVAETLNLLNVIRAIQQDQNLYDASKFYEMQAAGLERLGGLSAFGAVFGIGTEERKTMLAFYDDLGIEVNRSFYEHAFSMPDAYLVKNLFHDVTAAMESGYQLSEAQLNQLATVFNDDIMSIIKGMNSLVTTIDMNNYHLDGLNKTAEETGEGISGVASEIENLTQEIYGFGNAREELFFGGKYGNVTGSLYKQVVTQGVGTLYHKNEIIMSNNFHGFFNEREAADRIIAVLDQYVATQS